MKHIYKIYKAAILIILACFGLGTAIPAALAFAEDTAYESGAPFSEQDILDAIDEFITVPDGALDWNLLGTTGTEEIEERDEQGFDFYYIRPDFPPAVKVLDGEFVTVKGFMFPLGGEERQSLFLMGPFPVSCPFHYHTPPALVIEVHAENDPVPFSYEPVTVQGRLELIEDDPESYGVFYRLHDIRYRP